MTISRRNLCLGAAWMCVSAQAATRIPWHRPGAVKLVADGNSIVQGCQDGPQSVGGVPGYLHRNVAPFTSHDYANVAIGGQTTDDMRARPQDVDGAFDPTRANVLLVQEGTNQANTADDPATNCDKLLAYIRERRARHPWAAVVVATAPPVFLGDAHPQSETDAYNARLDAFNALLRRRWREVADALVETRCAGSPFDQARFPNYRRATFYDLRNDAALITEPPSSRYPACKIHPTAAAIAALAPIWAAVLRHV